MHNWCLQIKALFWREVEKTHRKRGSAMKYFERCRNVVFVICEAGVEGYW